MNLKRGATFDFSGPVQAMDGGQAVTDFTGWQARSQVRTVSGALVADLAVTWLTRAPGAIRLYAADTSSWPVGAVKIDVLLIAPDGAYAPTDTQTIVIGDQVTERPAA